MATAAVMVRGSRALSKFDPKTTKVNVAKLDAIIDYAKRMMEWPLLEQAVDAKVEQQVEFVQWWRERVRGAGGRDKAKSPDRGFQTVAQLEKQTGISDTQVSKWAKRTKEPKKYRQKLYDAAYKAAMATVAGNFMSETSEWYTPAKYIESVRAVFGGVIDLDPASCAAANQVVRAEHFYCERERGEKRAWLGKVFLNPPYGVVNGESRAGLFCAKAIEEYNAQRATECIILVNSVHAQSWQRPLYEFPVCLVDHRIQFADSDGEINPNPTFMNLFVYLGPNKARFVDEFKQHGYVLEKVK